MKVGAMAGNEYVLTEEGKAKLEEELHFLETDKRAEIGERIKVAREFGDISENSEYDDAKNEQGMMEARIAEINRILSEATIVSSSKSSTKVNIGSTVYVQMNGAERVFTIVGAAESNVAEGKISNESPVGAALLGHKKGDTIQAQGPTGREINLVIEKIKR
jgi:transcription elongation factor GreA